LGFRPNFKLNLCHGIPDNERAALLKRCGARPILPEWNSFGTATPLRARIHIEASTWRAGWM